MKALGLELESGKAFSETKNHWAKDIIATAYKHGIIKGYSDTAFGVNDEITREQMAAIIFALEFQQGQGKHFTDSEHIADGIIVPRS